MATAAAARRQSKPPQFEWAWQNPQLSRHFQQAPPTTEELMRGPAKRRRNRLPARLAPSLLSLARLLQMPLWTRLGLRLNFTTPELLDRFRRLRPAPPPHMVWLQRPLASLAPARGAAGRTQQSWRMPRTERRA